MPANISVIPISDWILGNQSAIHDGVMACQSTIEGLPVEK